MKEGIREEKRGSGGSVKGEKGRAMESLEKVV